MKTKELEYLIKNGSGVLPNQAINAIKEMGFIQNSHINPGPSSLDLALGDLCFEVDVVGLPDENQTVYDLIKNDLNGRQVKEKVLLPGRNYIILHEEKFCLPHSLYGYANPKSTTGRNFVHARMMADNVNMFDHLPRGHGGMIWTLVTPLIWPIVYEPGKDSLNQIRVFIKDSRLSEFEVMALQAKYGSMKLSDGEKIFSSRKIIRGGDHGYMIFSADCSGEILGYRALKSMTPVPIGISNSCLAKDYFEVIEGKGSVTLSPEDYYILSSLEKVSIPVDMAAEVKAVDERMGEYRSHFAGFFDSAFGLDKDNDSFGNNITLEVKVSEKMRIKTGQPICSLHFEKMACVPTLTYEKATGNYKVQVGPGLARQFY